MKNKTGNLIQKLLRFIFNICPFNLGYYQIFKLINKFPFKNKEQLLYVKSLGCSIYFNPSTFLGKHLYYFGKFEDLTTDFLKKHLIPNMVFYDIGANIGYYSCLAAKAVSPHGSVYAFEPQLACSAVLKKNAAINNFNNIHILQTALSDIDTNGRIYSRNSVTYDGHACLCDKGDSAFINSESVKCATLDHLIMSKTIPSCDIMKIDVEGAEYKVLKGASNLLINTPPKLIAIEVINEHLQLFGSTDKEVLELLQRHGYRTAFYRRGRWHPFISIVSYKKAGSPPNFVAVHDMPDNQKILRTVGFKNGTNA